MFVIEDEAHAEIQGEYETFEAAIAELRRRASTPWDQRPNVAPCMAWQTCGRQYEVVEYDTNETPWREVQRELVLEVSASGTKWHRETRTWRDGG